MIEEHMFKETLFIDNVEIDLWDSGLINITTFIHFPIEDVDIEILEQIHAKCFHKKKCSDSTSCMNHCDGMELISYVKRYLWMDTRL